MPKGTVQTLGCGCRDLFCALLIVMSFKGHWGCRLAYTAAQF